MKLEYLNIYQSHISKNVITIYITNNMVFVIRTKYNILSYMSQKIKYFQFIDLQLKHLRKLTREETS